MLKVATKFKPKTGAFEAAEAAGFRYAEFWLDAGWLSQWQAVARQAEESRLRFAMHFPNRGDLSEMTIRDAIRLYHELESPAMVIHTPMFERYGQRIVQQDPSLRLGVENHRLSPVEFERWACDHQCLTLDVEHLWKYTLSDAPIDALLKSVEDFLKRFRDKLVHVHLPGYAPGRDEHRPMYCSREMVLPVLSLLADHQFDGLIVSEVSTRFQNFHDLRMDVLLFERWQQIRSSEEKSRHRSNPKVA